MHGDQIWVTNIIGVIISNSGQDAAGEVIFHWISQKQIDLILFSELSAQDLWINENPPELL